MRLRTVVAIPAKDEADHLPACLLALAAQTRPPEAAIVLLNGCRDGSREAVASVEGGLPFAVHAREIELPAGRACAGWARRLAMQEAARIAGPDGVLLGTDADAIADPDWVAACLRAIEGGAEAVAGMADIDPGDAALIPAALHEDDALECGYGRLLDELAWLIDPDPADPWPRHTQQNGASFAVSVRAWRRAGGIPPVRLGEDRAFFASLARVDARVRHSLAARVTVSGRLFGRAPGGMADTMRRRLEGPDAFLNPSLEPAADAAARLTWRRQVRRRWRDGVDEHSRLSAALGVPAASLARWMSRPFFGSAWAAIEARSPLLWRRRVPAADLARQTAEAGLILARVRLATEDAGSARLTMAG